jgi:hypothetical protein
MPLRHLSRCSNTHHFPAARPGQAIDPLLRGPVIPFGSAGHVALFEIDGPSHVSILAVRHQREEDYH